MYILIERERLPEGRHYERMPDGRCIVSGREAKMMGTLEDVTIVPNTALLNQLRGQVATEPNEKAVDETDAVTPTEQQNVEDSVESKEKEETV